MGSEFSRAQGGAATPITVDYYAVLMRVIETSDANSHLLRRAVYNKARESLFREAVTSQASIGSPEYQLQRGALESAIDRIEEEHRSLQSQIGVSVTKRVDAVIQITCALILAIVVLAVAAGYIDIHPAR